MNGQELCGQVCGVLLLLLLLLGQSVAVAPGDEDVRCPVPEYPDNVKVLMDSWRYHTLITEDGGNGVWTATTLTLGMTWSSQGTCSSSSVSVCFGGREGKWLRTQLINKALPSPNTYPVRIFVNVKYSFMDCPRQECDDNFELLLASHDTSYGEGGIMPDNSIQNTSGVSSGTKQFFFDSETSVTGILLALKSIGTCVTVSRVLVYRYECPGHDRLPTRNLLRRPATQSSVSRFVLVTPYCAENSHLICNDTQMILCFYNGVWVNGDARCERNSGYTEDQEGTTCKALTLIHYQSSTTPTEKSTSDVSLISTSTLYGTNGPTISSTKTSSVAPFAHYFTNVSTATKTSSVVTPTPLIDDTIDSSALNTIVVALAGVGGAFGAVIMVLFIIILVVIVVKHKHKSVVVKSDLGGDPCTTTENVAYAATVKFATHNPVYEDIPSATTDDPVTAENVAYETTVIPCNPAYESVTRQDLAISSATAAT